MLGCIVTAESLLLADEVSMIWVVQSENSDSVRLRASVVLLLDWLHSEKQTRKTSEGFYGGCYSSFVGSFFGDLRGHFGLVSNLCSSHSVGDFTFQAMSHGPEHPHTRNIAVLSQSSSE